MKLLLIICALFMLPTPLVYAEDKQKVNPNDVDEILDDLETRLLKEKSGSLKLGGSKKSPPSQAASQEELVRKFKYEGSTITGQPPEMRELAAIGRAIAKLEADIEVLAADVQNSKQEILSDAKINNFITIETHLGKTDSAAIKSIQVKLDGYDIYKIMDSSGLWMPTKTLPLYAGPLQPGSHRVDIEARIILRHGKGLPLNNDIYRFLNKSFEVNVPEGFVHKKYVVAIEPPEGLNDEAKATIKESLKRQD